MFTVIVIEPTSFVAVISYNVRFMISVGIPLNSPVDVSNTKPGEGSGVMDQSVTAPPVESGCITRTLELLRRTESDGTYAIIGTWSRTVMLNCVVVVPPVLVA